MDKLETRWKDKVWALKSCPNSPKQDHFIGTRPILALSLLKRVYSSEVG